MEQQDRIKQLMNFLAISHFFEALIAVRAAKKRGLSRVKYFFLTWIFGVFVLIPLLRKPKVEEEEEG
jgi:hypothetical protein